MKNIEIDFSAVTRQFEGLQGRHPGLWPALPRTLLLVGLLAALLFVGWLVYWRGLIEELEAGQQQEQQLRGEFQDKVKKAVNLDDLRRQKAQVEQYVGVLEKQLPSRAEMLSGRTSFKNGFYPGGALAKEGPPLWAEWMRRAGYRSGRSARLEIDLAPGAAGIVVDGEAIVGDAGVSAVITAHETVRWLGPGALDTRSNRG